MQPAGFQQREIYLQGHILLKRQLLTERCGWKSCEGLDPGDHQVAVKTEGSLAQTRPLTPLTVALKP